MKDPQNSPKLLICNIILELMRAYDKIRNGHGNGSIHRIGKKFSNW